VLDAVDEAVLRPSAAAEAARGAVRDLRTTATRAASVAGGLFAAARSTLFPAPASPLNEPVGRQRRVAVARVPLDDVKAVRKAQGGTVNDVLLTVLTGALREWLLSRGQPVVGSTTVRALVPLAEQGGDTGGPDTESADTGSPGGGRITSHLVDLPVGEPNPRVRLARISYALRAVSRPGQSVRADALLALTGFAPPTLHALGARAARGLSRRLFNLVVTNVPGPQQPLYAAGTRVLEVFPVVPLAPGQGLAVGMTSYDGCVYMGLDADRDTVGDVDVLADLLQQAAAELVESAG
jgi:WS/DGAT/MGAT family acyltransferase